MNNKKTSVKISRRCTCNTSANNDTFLQLDGEYFGQEEEIFFQSNQEQRGKFLCVRKKSIHQSTQFPNHKNM